MEGWYKPKQAAEYAGMKERTGRTWIKNGLRHVRLPSGTILIKREWIDQYLMGYEHKGNEIDDIVDEVIGKI